MPTDWIRRADVLLCGKLTRLRSSVDEPGARHPPVRSTFRHAWPQNRYDFRSRRRRRRATGVDGNASLTDNMVT